MSTITENPALTAELQRLAAEHIAAARETFGIEFDFTEQSIAQLDGAISRVPSAGEDTAVIGLGSYVGETIRRNLGGVWVQDERGVALVEQVGGVDVSASPFSWIQKRVAGADGTSITQCFATLRENVQRARSAATATPPPSPGLKIAGAPKTDGAAYDSQVLARAPLLVFLLVAAADGKVDKKELKAFEKILESAIRCPSPRLREAIAELLPQIDVHYEHICSGNVDPGSELQQVAQIVDTHFPAEAQAFKESLVAIAVKIAQSSGGFLGFGSKIDKNEQVAIAIVAQTLGLLR